MSKPLAPFSPIMTLVGLTLFKWSRSRICFQVGPFVKNVFEKDQNCVIYT
jgi:hypothetical protein